MAPSAESSTTCMASSAFCADHSRTTAGVIASEVLEDLRLGVGVSGWSLLLLGKGSFFSSVAGFGSICPTESLSRPGNNFALPVGFTPHVEVHGF